MEGASSGPDLTAEESKNQGRNTAKGTELPGDKIFSASIFPYQTRRSVVAGMMPDT